MKPERIIEILTFMRDRLYRKGVLDDEMTEAFNEAILIVDKQIPRKANKTKDMKLHCPRCNNWIAHWQKHCDNCGQLLDWTGDPEIVVKPQEKEAE